MKLTPREQEVYDLTVLEGLSHKKIAERLNVDRRTIASCLKIVHKKMHVTSKWELIVKHYKAKYELPFGLPIGNASLEVKLTESQAYAEGLKHSLLALEQKMKDAQNGKVICADCNAALLRF